MTKLVYIGGYGRSGSTLLEYALTKHPKVVGCGEVERHIRRHGRRKICTCGRLLQDCPVWGRFQHKERKLEGWDHEQLTLALLAHVWAEYKVMVDSSKTAWGSAGAPFQFARRRGKDFLLVHIVRDPRGVCWSNMRTSSEAKTGGRREPLLIAALRAGLGWMVANLACEIFGWRYPNNYLRLRYEDLTRAPLKIVSEVLQKVDVRSRPKPGNAADNRHQLYGNAMRFKPPSLLDLKEDVAWKTGMSKTHQRLVSSLTWPLAVRYGYLSR